MKNTRSSHGMSEPSGIRGLAESSCYFGSLKNKMESIEVFVWLVFALAISDREKFTMHLKSSSGVFDLKC